MTIALPRRRLLALVAALPVAAALPAAAQTETAPGVLGDIVLGDPGAPVTVIEYASMTCPHCADFHTDTFPALREKYIDTGKVRFILREVYFDPYGLWASMLARCGGEAGFYPMVEAMLKRQREWSRADDVAAELQKIGRLNGLGTEQMRACLTDQDYAQALVSDYQRNADADGISSTPSFVINGTLHSGNIDIDRLSEIIDAEL